MKLTLVFLGLLCGVLASQVSYENYTVYRVTPTTEAQVKALRDVDESNSGYSFWTDIGYVNKPVDIMIPPNLIGDFKEFLSAHQISSEVYIENVQEKIDNERPYNLKLASSRAVGWTDYYTLTEIYDWLDSLAAEFPEVEVIVGGSTFEGREIRGVRVSFSAANANNVVFIEGGIHAREWISPAVSTYLLNEILRSDDADIREMAERYDWIIFPVFNPDGYEYTFSTNRMWRKTRTPYGSCFGADPNRNWGFQWNTGGASNNPCSETYAGPYAFSEVSTRTMSEYISSISDQITAYISFHSYSQLLLRPYGHTRQDLENYQELQEVGEAAAAALAERFGTRFTVGNIAATIYIASGGSMDWVKGTYGTRIAYTYELRDLGRYGFLLPADQILPSGLETMDSLLAIMNGFNERK